MGSTSRVFSCNRFSGMATSFDSNDRPGIRLEVGKWLSYLRCKEAQHKYNSPLVFSLGCSGHFHEIFVGWLQAGICFRRFAQTGALRGRNDPIVRWNITTQFLMTGKTGEIGNHFSACSRSDTSNNTHTNNINVSSIILPPWSDRQRVFWVNWRRRSHWRRCRVASAAASCWKRKRKYHVCSGCRLYPSMTEKGNCWIRKCGK